MKRDNTCLHRGPSCHRSIANTVIRTVAKSGKSNLPRSRSRRKHLGRARFRCPVRTRFPVARSAARCCRPRPKRSDNVRSASSNFTPAGSARISTPRAGSNARNLSPSGSPVRTSAINVRFIRCGFEWRRKPQRRVRRGRWMHGRHSRISSRSSSVTRTVIQHSVSHSRSKMSGALTARSKVPIAECCLTASASGVTESR